MCVRCVHGVCRVCVWCVCRVCVGVCGVCRVCGVCIVCDVGGGIYFSIHFKPSVVQTSLTRSLLNNNWLLYI